MRLPPLSMVRKRWELWWEARLPKSNEVTLTHRNLYILPTKTGWVFAVVLIVLLLASINERVNLGYGLVFLLGSSALAAAHLTHGNLQGIGLRLLSVRSAHAGDTLRLNISMRNASSREGRLGIQVFILTGGEHQVELPPGGDVTVTLDIPAGQRGWMTLPRITIASSYPLGFFRAWAYWLPQSQVLVWPALDASAPPLPRAVTDSGQGSPIPSRHSPQDVQDGLRDYRHGDPLRWIAWKKSSHAIAAGTGLVSRTSEQSRSEDLWLDYGQSVGLSGLSKEARLSRLATWLLAAEEEAQGTAGLYGLKLPGMELPCGSGNSHLKTCLDTLATWSAGDVEQA